MHMWVVNSLWVCERKLAMERSTTLSRVVKDKFNSIMTVDYMSSEESEENGHSLVVHPLAWKSEKRFLPWTGRVPASARPGPAE